eukprot:2760053-Rhodomonas_salina.2
MRYDHVQLAHVQQDWYRIGGCGRTKLKILAQNFRKHEIEKREEDFVSWFGMVGEAAARVRWVTLFRSRCAMSGTDIGYNFDGVRRSTRSMAGRHWGWMMALGIALVCCTSLAYCRSAWPHSPAVRDISLPLRQCDRESSKMLLGARRLSLRGGDGDASQQQLAVPYEGEIKELLHGMQSIDNEARTGSTLISYA